MGSSRIWRHGRLWTALVIGVPAGTLFGLLQLGFSDRFGRALAAGVGFGVLFGAAMSAWTWSRWKAAKKLSPHDRRAVARSVSKGEPIEDPRLAPAVLEYAEVVRRSHDREQRYRWTLWIWPTLTLALAVENTVNGPTRRAVILWALVVSWPVLTASLRKRESKTISRASSAESSARQLLDD